MTVFDYTWDMIQTLETGKDRGKVVNDPNDPGGLTKYGFSSRYNPDLDVAHLTEDLAKYYFRSRYWNAVNADNLPPRIAIAVVDTAFAPPGMPRAIRDLQYALRVAADGVVGPNTLAAVRAANEADLINSFMSWRMLDIADMKPMYRRGLFVRVLRVKDYISDYKEV